MLSWQPAWGTSGGLRLWLVCVAGVQTVELQALYFVYPQRCRRELLLPRRLSRIAVGLVALTSRRGPDLARKAKAHDVAMAVLRNASTAASPLQHRT